MNIDVQLIKAANDSLLDQLINFIETYGEKNNVNLRTEIQDEEILLRIPYDDLEVWDEEDHGDDQAVLYRCFCLSLLNGEIKLHTQTETTTQMGTCTTAYTDSILPTVELKFLLSLQEFVQNTLIK